jgi:hypothetical protein
MDAGVSHPPVGRLRKSTREYVIGRLADCANAPGRGHSSAVRGKALGHRQNVRSVTSSHQVAPVQLKLECHGQRGAGGCSE